MATLVIAEKPDMAEKIAQAIIGKYTKKSGYFEGNGYFITYAFGHLLGLAEPEVYDARYKTWNLADLPIIPTGPEGFKLSADPKKANQLKIIGNLAKQCSEVINACDAAREGELIFRYICQYLKISKPTKRLWISSLTKTAIQEGFENLKPSSNYENLHKAARSRSQADWLIGMNGTRAFSTKFGEPGKPLSIGRVQTPVLAMLYDRQIAIESFKPEKYFEVEAIFSQTNETYKGIWLTKERLFDRSNADRISKKIKGKQGTITKFETVDVNETPPPLYDLGDLQQDASAKFGFTAIHTLNIAQKLYEEHAAISYPRTTSNAIAADNIPVIHNVLDQLKGTIYDPLVQKANKSFVNVSNKNICRPEDIEDHHAIFPTETIPRIFDLTKDEQRLYDLIVRRFLGHFFPNAHYKKHNIFTEVENETFRTSIRELVHKGWKVVNENIEHLGKTNSIMDSPESSEEPNEELKEKFTVDPNKPVTCIVSETKDKITSPPKWFTEGSLIKAMKTAGKELTDEALRQEMKGLELGTPATRAAIIETLKKRGYVEVNKRKLVVTSRGKALIETVRTTDLGVLTNPSLTAQWEKRLREISLGQASDAQFMNTVKLFAEKIVQKVKEQEKTTKDIFLTEIGTCPACKIGKITEKPKSYTCTNHDKGCKFILWKEQFKRTLSLKDVKDLLSKGKTSELKFPKIAGGDYKAKLFFEDLSSGKLSREFSHRSPSSPQRSSKSDKHDKYKKS